MIVDNTEEDAMPRTVPRTVRDDASWVGDAPRRVSSEEELAPTPEVLRRCDKHCTRSVRLLRPLLSPPSLTCGANKTTLAILKLLQPRPAAAGS